MVRYCPLCDRRMDDAECPTDGVPTVDLAVINPQGAALVPGTVVAERYQVEREIGEGAMGTVFLATRIGMKNRVALKVLRREVMVSQNLLKRFYQEARAVSSLDHPNIVRIVDFGIDVKTTLPFLAMEFVEGPTLRDLVLAYGRMPERRCAALLAQVAKALVEAHQKSVVHRDLKPANIVVCMLADGDEHVKVLDFGVAKVLDPAELGGPRVTIPGTALGTPLYMSPEQASGRDVDSRSDLYSLGCILHELLTGEPPFMAQEMRQVMQKQLIEPAPALPQRLSDGDPPSHDLVALHKALLAKDRDDRPQSTAVVAWILGALSRGEQIGAGSLLRRAKNPIDSSISNELPAATYHDEDETERHHFSELNVTIKTNLGPEVTSFIGREASLKELDGLFDSGARLVTIFGAGGTGKTRLAKRYGALKVDKFSKNGGGVWFADLTEASSLEDVSTAIGEALDVPLVGDPNDDGVSRIGQALEARGRMLLILDNFEHVAQHGAETIGRWLELAPESSFLVTSRELLLVAGEAHHALSPLPEAEGIALFENRAKAARTNFTLTGNERPWVAEIVRRLDGIPLAIELAAARVGVLSLEKLLERLSATFQVLGGGGRSVVPRHRTMRNAIDWSWNLLDPEEQSALAQASVFAGGFSLEAAEETIDLSEHAGSVLDVLQALRNKSLIRADEAPGFPGEMRFNMYGTIREYASEKLDALGLRAPTEARHTKFYLREAERWSEGSSGSRALLFLRLLRLEYDNLIAIKTRAGTKEPDVAARVALALEPMLAMRGPLEVAVQLMDVAVDCAERAGNHRLLVRALLAREHARTEAGATSMEQAKADIDRALAIAREIKSIELEGEALFSLAKLELEAFCFIEQARATYEAALALFRKTKQRLMEGRTLIRIGYVWIETNEIDKARANLNEGLEIVRALDDRRHEGYALTTISLLDHQMGLLGEAKIKLERGIAIHRSVGNRRNEGMDLGYFGFVSYEVGAFAEAKDALEKSIEICREVGLRKFQGLSHAILGALYADTGDVDRSSHEMMLAAERLSAIADPEIRAAARVLEGVLEVAEARRAREKSDRDTYQVRIDSARARIQEAKTLGPEANGADVRIALRILSKRVDALEPRQRGPSAISAT
jgi:serine/threonine protein kinase/predicted ATPase